MLGQQCGRHRGDKRRYVISVPHQLRHHRILSYDAFQSLVLAPNPGSPKPSLLSAAVSEVGIDHPLQVSLSNRFEALFTSRDHNLREKWLWSSALWSRASHSTQLSASHILNCVHVKHPVLMSYFFSQTSPAALIVTSNLP